MAMPPKAFLLAPRDAKQLRRGLRNQGGFDPAEGRAAARPDSQDSHHNWVKINGALAGTLYPGDWYQFNPADSSLTIRNQCWAREINGGTLDAGRYYWGRLEGDYADGVSIYGVDASTSGATTISGSVTQTIVTATTNAALPAITTTVDTTGVAAAGLGLNYPINVETSTAGVFVEASDQITTLTNVTSGSTIGQFVQTIDYHGTPETVYTITGAATLPTMVINSQMTFPSTGALNTAPVGYPVLPNITTTGTPTFTIAEGGLTWNATDNKFWVSQGGGTNVQVVTADGVATTGQVTFPTTGALNTAPTGYVTLPLVTTTGTPTFTIAEGTLVWNSVDNKLWASLGGGSFQEMASGTSTGMPTWTKVTKTFSDFSTAAATNTITAHVLVTKGVIHAACIKHTTAFSGGSIAAYTISLEDASGTLVNAFDVFQAPGDTVFDFDQLRNAYGPLNFGTTANITATAISVGDNLDQAAAGSVDFYLLLSTLP